MSKRTAETLEYLEISLAFEFAEAVGAVLRSLPDPEVNALFLMTHTPAHCGDHVSSWVKVLMPLIEAEQQLRHDIQTIPHLGPIVAPELYRKGGGHYVPF